MKKRIGLFLIMFGMCVGIQAAYSYDYTDPDGFDSDDSESFYDEEQSNVSANPVINNLYNNFWLEGQVAASADLESMGIVTTQDIKNLRQEIQGFLVKKQKELNGLQYALATGALTEDDLDYDQNNIELIVKQAQKQIRLLDKLV
jgi:hypothetical protein